MQRFGSGVSSSQVETSFRSFPFSSGWEQVCPKITNIKFIFPGEFFILVTGNRRLSRVNTRFAC